MRHYMKLILCACLLLLPAVMAQGQDGNVHLIMGNPSNAKHDSNSPDNYLMIKPQFAVSYNDKKGTPNWVSYRLVKSDFGKTVRPKDFYPDPDLPRSFYHVKPLEYHFTTTGM